MTKLPVTGRMAKQLDGVTIQSQQGVLGLALVEMDGGEVGYKAAYVVEVFRDGRYVATMPGRAWTEADGRAAYSAAVEQLQARAAR